jgi:HK97 gp10 family phage protein
MPDIKTGSIQITGLADLEKRLLEFSDKLALNVMKGAVRAGAVVIQKEARARAPRSDKPHLLVSRRTKHMRREGKSYQGVWINPGNVRKNIKVRLAPRKSRTRPVEYWIYVSQKTAWYWKFLEFGTSKMAAKPFLRPAFESMKEQATEAMRDYLAQRIEKEAVK